jgi:hypothetical protein
MQKNILTLVFLLFLLVSLNRAAAASVTLGWNGNFSPATAGYNIYYGTACGCYSNKINVGNVTSATITNLSAGVTYYFSATTYDADGGESAFSNETTFIAAGVLTLSRGQNASDPPLIKFPVQNGHWYEVQATTDLHSWVTIWQTGTATSNNWVQFSDPNAGGYRSRFYRLALH